MKEEGKNITEIFKKYFSGSTSRIELRELEKEAQSNPYIQDAKEGIDQMSTVNRDTTISNLDKRLSKRLNKNQRGTSNMPWLKLAAGLALLLSVGFFIWRPLGGNSVATKEAIQNEQALENTSTKTFKTDLPATEEAVDRMENASNEIIEENEALTYKFEDQSSIVDNTNSKVQSSEARKNEISEAVSTTIVSDNSDPVLSPPKSQIPPSSYSIDEIPPKSYEVDIAQEVAQSSDAIPNAGSGYTDLSEDNNLQKEEKAIVDTESKTNVLKAKKKREISDLESTAAESNAKAKSKIVTEGSTRNISGIIMDDAGEALIGASIIVDNTKIGTITDLDGTFELDLPEDAESLLVSYTGFENQSLILGDEEYIEVALEQGVSLSEVVVTQFDASDDSTEDLYPDSPDGGMNAFKQYLKSNLVIPDGAKENNIKGKVILLFDVDAAGKPFDIEVKKSLGYGCDEEAIRLLQDGPTWIQGNLNSKTRIVVRFR